MTRCYVYYQYLKKEIENLKSDKRKKRNIQKGEELEEMNDKLFKLITKKDSLR